jgi:hypothetical protein
VTLEIAAGPVANVISAGPASTNFVANVGVTACGQPHHSSYNLNDPDAGILLPFKIKAPIYDDANGLIGCDIRGTTNSGVEKIKTSDRGIKDIPALKPPADIPIDVVEGDRIPGVVPGVVLCAAFEYRKGRRR